MKKYIPLIVSSICIVGFAGAAAYLLLGSASDTQVPMLSEEAGEHVDADTGSQAQETDVMQQGEDSAMRNATQRTFSSSELGFGFPVPSGYEAITMTGEFSGDIGRHGVYLSSQDGETHVLASFDVVDPGYAPLIEMGCCSFYDGPSISGIVSEFQPLQLEESHPFGVREISVGGKNGLRFYRINSEGDDVFIVDSVLFPLENSYKNVLITSAALVNRLSENTILLQDYAAGFIEADELSDLMLPFLQNTENLEPPVVVMEQAFDQLVNSVVFTKSS